MTVTIRDIARAAAARGAVVTSDTAGYLVLGALESLLRGCFEPSPERVALAEDGSVAVAAGPTVSEREAEGALRDGLQQVLAVSHGPLGSMAGVAGRPPAGDLATLAGELHAALIPLNRAAGRRALARLHREVMRAIARGQQADPPTPSKAPVTTVPPAPPAVAPTFTMPAPLAVAIPTTEHTLRVPDVAPVPVIGPESEAAFEGAEHGGAPYDAPRSAAELDAMLVLEHTPLLGTTGVTLERVPPPAARPPEVVVDRVEPASAAFADAPRTAARLDPLVEPSHEATSDGARQVDEAERASSPDPMEEEAERLIAEARAEAERQAAEAERLEALRLAEEAAAEAERQAAEAERLEALRLAEEARVAAARQAAEAERLEAERLIAEARAEAERQAAEAERLEALRLAEEARVAAARQAAEVARKAEAEAARQLEEVAREDAARQAEARARAESARLVAEEARRVEAEATEAEEQARLVEAQAQHAAETARRAEESARLAVEAARQAEEAARAEATRLGQEAARADAARRAEAEARAAAEEAARRAERDAAERKRYRPRKSDVSDLLAAFKVVDSRSDAEIARDLKSMAGIDVTPPPVTLLDDSPAGGDDVPGDAPPRGGGRARAVGSVLGVLLVAGVVAFGFGGAGHLATRTHACRATVEVQGVEPGTIMRVRAMDGQAEWRQRAAAEPRVEIAGLGCERDLEVVLGNGRAWHRLVVSTGAIAQAEEDAASERHVVVSARGDAP